jgi:hypothetical protein
VDIDARLLLLLSIVGYDTKKDLVPGAVLHCDDCTRSLLYIMVVLRPSLGTFEYLALLVKTCSTTQASSVAERFALVPRKFNDI